MSHLAGPVGQHCSIKVAVPTHHDKTRRHSEKGGGGHITQLQLHLSMSFTILTHCYSAAPQHSVRSGERALSWTDKTQWQGLWWGFDTHNDNTAHVQVHLHPPVWSQADQHIHNPHKSAQAGTKAVECCSSLAPSLHPHHPPVCPACLSHLPWKKRVWKRVNATPT